MCIRRANFCGPPFYRLALLCPFESGWLTSGGPRRAIGLPARGRRYLRPSRPSASMIFGNWPTLASTSQGATTGYARRTGSERLSAPMFAALGVATAKGPQLDPCRASAAGSIQSRSESAPWPKRVLPRRLTSCRPIPEFGAHVLAHPFPADRVVKVLVASARDRIDEELTRIGRFSHQPQLTLQHEKRVAH
jgi:hypothetical protein